VPTDIALFPLSTVLFPGGLLPLRIFETRYVDMVGRCMRRDEAFGVVLSKDGSETNSSVETAAVGTTARIVDFQTLEGGLLGLLCRGESRFRIAQRTRQSDGLNLASVEWMADVPVAALLPQYQPLVGLLRDALSRMDNLGRFIEPDYDSASWVSYRLADLMPLPVTVQQRLLEIDDPNERLSLLAPLLDIGAAG
jgi:Lon protease-like protein